jgi:thioredoxin reductase
VNIFEGFEKGEELEEITEKIVKLAKNLKLECEIEDVEELLDCETKELSDENLIELEAQRVVAEKAREEKEKEEEPEKKFTAKGLSDSFSQLNKALASFEAMDPNVERFTKVKRIIQDAVCCYHDKYEKRKETDCSNKAEHVPHQENISYLNPRT